jgi:hypothetical protein
MSVSVFQASITLNTTPTETSYGSGVWTMDFKFLDHEGTYNGLNVLVGDVIILDTSGTDPGTLSRYTIDTIYSKTPTTVSVQATYDVGNIYPSPDLGGYELAAPGLITRKTPNYSLLNLPSLQIQLLSDKFAFYLINYMNSDIVDNITGGGGGGGTTTKPDWNALSTDPAGILNKPILGTASTHNVPATGDAVGTQVVLGNDSRLASSNQVLTNATPTPTTIGGITAGTTFSSMPVETVLQNLLYPYQSPAFSAFGISGQATPIEVGASVSGGSHTFTWSTTNSTNINANSISIIDATTSTTLASGLANTGSNAISISAVTNITATTHQWRIQAVNTNAIALSTTYTVTWQWKRFYGESTNTSVVAADVQALRVGGLAAAFAGTYAFNAGGYKYIAYPTSFGTATSFKDQSTNLDVPFQTVQTLSITNTNGITTNYNVHRTVNIIGSAMNIVVA